MSLTLPPCPGCGVQLFRPGAGAREGARPRAARGMCSTCYQRHRMAGTLDEVAGSLTEASTYVPARERSGTFGQFQMHPSHLKTGRLDPSPAGFTRSSVVDGPLVDLAPDITHAAALQVCGRSEGPDDARAILVMLGLVSA